LRSAPRDPPAGKHAVLRFRTSPAHARPPFGAAQGLQVCISRAFHLEERP
jgi:hypothetical protein